MSTSTPTVLAPAKALDYQRRCPVCDADRIERGYDLKDFVALRCSDCQTAWRSNMYTPEQVAAMYEDEPYEEHPFFGYDSDAETLRKVPRYQRFQQGLGVLEREVSVGKLLDVGCGAGTFMAIAAQHGWDVYGVEMNEALCGEVDKAVGPGRVTVGAFEALDPEAEEHRYDAITLWDVIEHVLDPMAFIERAQKMLRPGGVIVICTPDEESVLANTGKTILRASGGRWNYPALALHPRYHTFFFSGTSLENLFTARGMKVVESYSQAAFAAHSDLASKGQKIAIGFIEKLAGLRDRRYERVIFAQAPKA
jgi:2-polyprenyl-3-methyl-5-hydroxy-6-metoxy-1,4-benzoquinol methylase